MNSKTPLDDAPWPPSLALRVERVCNRFEAACKAGQRPRIEHYLGQTPEPERPVLLRELLAVEVEYRRRSGEGITPDEYCSQFAEYTDLIRDVLGRTNSCAPRGSAPAPAPAPRGSDDQPTVPGYEVLAE